MSNSLVFNKVVHKDANNRIYNEGVGIGTTVISEKLHLVGNMLLQGHLIPSSCNVFDIGTSNLRFKDIYLSGNTIDLGGTLIKRNQETGDLLVSTPSGNPVDISANSITVSSSNLVSNLNADLLDGQQGSFYQNATNINNGTLNPLYGGTGATFVTGTGSNVLSDSPTFTGIITANNVNVSADISCYKLTTLAPTGIKALSIQSTTLVTNLNADLLDNQEGSFYQNATNINAGALNPLYGGTGATFVTGTGSNVLSVSPTFTGTIQSANLTASGTVAANAITVSSSTVVTNLNADLLDGQDGSYYQNVNNMNAGTLPVERGGTGCNVLTANKVLVGNGTNSILQPTNLHWDNTNSRLGINNQFPSNALDVNGNAYISGTISASNLSIIGDFVTMNTVTSNTEQMVINNIGTGPALRVIQSGNTPLAEFVDNESGTAMFIDNNGLIGFSTNVPLAKLYVLETGVVDAFRVDDQASDTTPFIIKADGFVGIGKTNPGYALDVNGTIYSQNGILSANWISSTGSMTCGGFDFILGNTDQVTRGNTGGSRALVKDTNATLSINFDGDFTGGTKIYNNLQVTGNVGIGVTNPSEKLVIAGSVQIGTGSGDYRQLKIGGGNSSGFLYGCFAKYGDGIHLSYNFYNDNVNNVILNPGGETTRLSIGYNAVSIFTGSVNSEPNNLRFIVRNSGFVGIGGISVPNEALEVQGNIALSGAARFVGTRDNNNLSIRTNNTDRITILNDGKVGIGITQPVADLVVGFAGTTGEATYKGVIQIAGGTGSVTQSGGLEFKSSSAGPGWGWRISAPDFGAGDVPMSFQSRGGSANWTERIRITNDGKVGIGSTTPQYSLDVRGTNYSGGVYDVSSLVKNNNDSGSLTLPVTISGNNADVNLRGAYLYTGFTGIPGRFIIYYDADNTTDSTIVYTYINGGRQNTSQPEFTLAAAGVTGEQYLVHDYDATNWIHFKFSIGYGGQVRLTKVEFVPTGNLISGGMLDVKYPTLSKFSSGGIRLTQIGGAGLYGGEVRGYLDQNIGSGLIFNTFDNGTSGYGNEAMRIVAATRNVGIGTTNPQAILHVKNAVSKTSDGTIAMLETNDTSPIRLIIGQVGSASAVSQGIWIDASESGVSDDRQLILQRYGGSVGIGTASPQERLHIHAGNIALTGGTRHIGTRDNNSLNLRTNNTDRITIDTNGNVGIGYVGSDRKLWVEGTSRFRITNLNPNQSTDLNFFEAKTTSGTITEFRLNRLHLSYFTNYATGSDGIYFWGNDLYVFNADSNSAGYIHHMAGQRAMCFNRAGSLSVAESLRRVNYAEGVFGLFQNDLNANANDARGIYGRVFNNNGDYITVGRGVWGEVNNVNNTNTSTTKTITTGYGVAGFLHNQTRSDRTAGNATMADANGLWTEVLSQYTGATITNAHAANLTITVRDSGTITNGYLIRANYNNFNNGTITNKWGLYLTNEEKNYISGNVGIGNISPNAQLDIRQLSTMQTLTFSSVNSQSQLALRGFGDANDGLFLGNFGDSAGNNPVGYIQYQWDGNSGRPLSINPLGGSVGIGITTPQDLLHVNGTVQANRFVTLKFSGPRQSYIYIGTYDYTSALEVYLSEGIGNAGYTSGIYNVTKEFGDTSSSVYVSGNGNIWNVEFVAVVESLNYTTYKLYTRSYVVDSNPNLNIAVRVISGSFTNEALSNSTTLPTNAGNVTYTTLANKTRVGIGLTNPAERLQVDGFIRSSSGYKVGSTTIIDNSNNISNVNFLTCLNTLYTYSSTNNTYGAFTSGNGQFLSIESFNLGNTVKRPIALNAYGGSVGIGITNPIHRLHAFGIVGASGIHLSNNYLETGQFGIRLVGIDNGVNGHNLRIQGRTTLDGAFTDVFTVTNTGLVGIGTLTPQESLQVEGNVALSGAARFVGTRDNNNLSFRTNNTDRITILNDGNVNITGNITKQTVGKLFLLNFQNETIGNNLYKTRTTASVLVNGTLERVTDGSVGPPDGVDDIVMKLTQTGSGAESYAIFQTITMQTTGTITGSIYVRTNISSSVEMFLFRNDVVMGVPGIFTTANTWHRLSFTTTVTAGNYVYLRVDNNTNNNTNVILYYTGLKLEYTSSATRWIPQGVDMTNAMLVPSIYSNSLQVNSIIASPNENPVFTASSITGNVGIGTVSPQELLQVDGNVALSGAARFIGTRTNHNLSLRTNNTDRITITNSGGIAIGNISSPASSSVHIEADTGSTLTTPNGPSITNFGQFVISSVSNVSAGASKGYIKFGYDHTTGVWGAGFIQTVVPNLYPSPLVINPVGGFVGIGTTNPQTALHVEGTVRSSNGYNVGANTVIDSGLYTIKSFRNTILKSTTDSGYTVFSAVSYFSGFIHMSCDYAGYDRTSHKLYNFTCCKSGTGGNITTNLTLMSDSTSIAADFNAIITLVPINGTQYNVNITTSGTRSGNSSVIIVVINGIGNG